MADKKNRFYKILPYIMTAVPQAWVLIVTFSIPRGGGDGNLGIGLLTIFTYFGMAGMAIIIGIIFSIRKRRWRYSLLGLSYLLAPIIGMLCG